MTTNGYSFSIRGDENVLELDSSGSFPICEYTVYTEVYSLKE